VWSFGVTAWELLTDGDTPYFAILADAAVVTHVISGGVRPAPETPGSGSFAPCFAFLPKVRPTFALLGVALGAAPPPLGTVPGGGAAASWGSPEIILCPITKKAMKDPATLPTSRFDRTKVDICFEDTAVSGFAVRGGAVFPLPD
jgi:hypothetical protein